MRNVDTKLLAKNKEYIYQVDFIQSMNLAFKDLNERLIDITAKCDVFSLQIRQDRIPEYLKPGNYFLGQYLITDIISYGNIESEKVYTQYDSVFKGHRSAFQSKRTSRVGFENEEKEMDLVTNFK